MGYLYCRHNIHLLYERIMRFELMHIERINVRMMIEHISKILVCIYICLIIHIYMT